MKRKVTKEFNQIKYQQEYNKTHYDRLEISIPKGQKAIVQEKAKIAGQSMKEYVMQAIRERIEREE